MRLGTWVDGVIGLVLIVLPFLGRLAPGIPGRYVEVALGLCLLAWAIVSFLGWGEGTGRLQRHGHA